MRGGEKVNRKILTLTLALFTISMIVLPTASACRNVDKTECSEVPFTGSAEIWLEDPGKISVFHNFLLIKNAYWKGTTTTETGTLPYERWYTIILNMKSGKGWFFAKAISTIEAAPGVVIGTFEGGVCGKITDYVLSSGHFKLKGTGVAEGMIIIGEMQNEIVEGDWITVGSHAVSAVSGVTYIPVA